MPKKIWKYSTKTLAVVLLIAITVMFNRSTKSFSNSAENKTVTNNVDVTMMALKVQENISNDLYAPKDTYVGHLTGYTADCPLCTGYLACNDDIDVLHGNEYYEDKDYGKVRIVASSRNLSCGTIIRFNKDNISSDPIYAIVLDRGVLGTAIDLLTNSEEYAIKTIGRSTISYDILRESWGKE